MQSNGGPLAAMPALRIRGFLDEELDVRRSFP